MKPEISLIISFYNRIDYLRLVLAGLERQSFKNFEVIIADDGSESKIVNEIENIAGNYTFQIIHLWQEDKGFRKNKILNRCITASSSGYLIFIDGDCVPHKNFIKEHFDYRKENIALTGRRVNLSEKITKKLTDDKIKIGFLEKSLLLQSFDGFFGSTTDVEKGLYFRNKFIRKFFNKKKRGLLGCNFSIHKEDFERINGFDERYEAPSIGEDSDVQFRFELYGGKIISLNNIAVQYHLYHKFQPRPQQNIDLFTNIQKGQIYFTPYGINHQKKP